MAINLVEDLYNKAQAIATYLQERGELSFFTEAEDQFRKILLLAAASYFEVYLTEAIGRFVEEELAPEHPLFKIVKTKGIDYKYHTWFDWDRRQANSFFRMFGDGFFHFMQEKLKVDPLLEASVSAFLELGQLRNSMVHQNYATFTLEKTIDEVYRLYKDATTFVYTIYGFLTEYRRGLAT